MNLKSLLIVLMSALSMSATGQDYTFEYSTDSYNELTSSTSLNGGMTWDDPKFTIPIGFNFKYFHETLSTIYLDDWGLGGELSADTTETGVYALLIPFGADIIDRGYDLNTGAPTNNSKSQISYQLDGNAGSRILKIQWKNAGFYGDLDNNGSSTDYVNFQLWLYEGSNDIQIRFGPNSVTDPAASYFGETGTYIGLFPGFDFDAFEPDEDGYVLSGNPTSPSFNTTSTIYENYINGTISNGTVYTFRSQIGSVPEIYRGSFRIYPVPAHGTMNLSYDRQLFHINEVSIYSAQGIRVLKQAYADQIDISGFAPGLYMVLAETRMGTITKTIVIY